MQYLKNSCQMKGENSLRVEITTTQFLGIVEGWRSKNKMAKWEKSGGNIETRKRTNERTLHSWEIRVARWIFETKGARDRIISLSWWLRKGGGGEKKEEKRKIREGLKEGWKNYGVERGRQKNAAISHSRPSVGPCTFRFINSSIPASRFPSPFHPPLFFFFLPLKVSRNQQRQVGCLEFFTLFWESFDFVVVRLFSLRNETNGLGLISAR